jgi:hypothetical protein
VQRNSTSNTRIISGGTITNIKGYIEGTLDVSGNAVTGTQLRAVTIDPDDYTILAATALTQAVTMALTMGSAYPFPWTSATTYAPTGWNNTTKVLSFGADPALVEVGDLIAVRETGAGSSRGQYRYGTVAGVNHGANTVTMDSSFSSTLVDTTGTAKIRPLPANASEIRTAVYDYFDALGPGDSTGDSARWPT